MPSARASGSGALPLQHDRRAMEELIRHLMTQWRVDELVSYLMSRWRVDDLLGYLIVEWRVIARSPSDSVVCRFLLGMVLVYGACRWRYRARIASLRSRLEQQSDRVAEYERKLQVASPDEAESLVEALERKIEMLRPRRVTAEQRRTIIEEVSAGAGRNISIVADATSPDAVSLAHSLANVFLCAGWKSMTTTRVGIDAAPVSGIGLKVRDRQVLSHPERLVYAGLRASGIEFDAQQRLCAAPPEYIVDAEIVITDRSLTWR